MRLLRALALIYGIVAPATAGQYFNSPITSTATGTAFQSLAGNFYIASSSASISSTTANVPTKSTWTIVLNGQAGSVTASQFNGTLSGNVSAPVLNNVVYANLLSGSDLGAQINAADTLLGTSSGTIAVTSSSGLIQTAVTLNSGHVLAFGPGVFTSSATIAIKSNAALSGAGMSQTTLNRWAGFTGDIAHFNFSRNASMHDFTVTATNPNIQISSEDLGAWFSTDGQIYNIKLTTHNYTGISVPASINLTISNCWLSGSQQTYEIWTAKSQGTAQNLTLFANHISSAYFNGAFLEGTNGATIVGNTFYRNAWGGYGGQLYVGYSTNTTISGNTFLWDSNQITANNGATGMEINASSQLTISGNSIRKHTGWGIALEPGDNNIVMTGNTIMDSGVNFENAASGLPPSGIIFWRGVSSVTISGNIIGDDQSSPTQSYGIVISTWYPDTSYPADYGVSIIGNQFLGNALGAISDVGNVSNGLNSVGTSLATISSMVVVNQLSAGSFLGVNGATETVTAALTGVGTVASPLGVNASSVAVLSSGLVPDAEIDGSSVTKQGNVFNGNSQLVQTNSSGQLPALSATNLTSIPAGGLTGAIPTTVTYSIKASTGVNTDLTSLNGASGNGQIGIGGTTATNIQVAINGNATANLWPLGAYANTGTHYPASNFSYAIGDNFLANSEMDLYSITTGVKGGFALIQGTGASSSQTLMTVSSATITEFGGVSLSSMTCNGTGSATYVGNATAGTITTNTSATTCTITFPVAFQHAPMCFWSDHAATTTTPYTSSASGSAVTVTLPTLSSGKIDYFCVGYQ